MKKEHYTVAESKMISSITFWKLVYRLHKNGFLTTLFISVMINYLEVNEKKMRNKGATDMLDWVKSRI